MPESVSSSFLGRIVNRITNLVISPQYSPSERTRVFFILGFYPAAALFSLALIFVNLSEHGHMQATEVYAGFLIALTLMDVYLVISKNIRLVAFTSSLLTFIFASYLNYEGGLFGHGQMWFILFPTIVYILNGFKKGNLWIIALMTELGILYYLITSGLLSLPYDTDALLEAFLVLLFAIGFTAFYQILFESGEKRLLALNRDLQKFKLAVENAAEHIIITDPDAKILYANLSASNITGFSISEMIGQTPRLWGGNMPKEFYEKMWKTIKTDKETFRAKVNNKRKDGRAYIADVAIAPVLNEKGEILYFVGIERDITKEEEVDRMKTEFVSLASHQLRTPLTAIKWFLEMLAGGDAGALNKEQKSFVDSVYQSNERMIALVNSLLNVSRIESGRIKVEPVPTKLAGLVNEIVSKLKPEIVEKEIKLILDIADNLPVINIDQKLIATVYENLLTNSLKYSPKNTSITFSLVQKDGEIISSVKDEGPGIPKNELPKVFDKFFRGSNILKEHPEGTGLGLYICKAIIDSSGGKIWVESVEGKGSTFSFSLPRSGMKAKKGEVSLTS